MRYSLADYILSIKPNDSEIAAMFGTISIGGEGNYLDSITIDTNSALWSVQGFATGGWVHNKNLDRSGSATLSLSQLSDAIAKLKKLCLISYVGDYDGFTLTLSNTKGELVATCIDAQISKIPAQDYSETAAMQSWSFVCGKVIYE